MRRAYRAGLILALVTASGCGSEPETARHRAFDGAPPVIPHEPFGAPCESCHGGEGPEVADLGYPPRAPHDQTAGMAFTRCRQCHVFQATDGLFRQTRFTGLRRVELGARAHPLAPPAIPHPVFMREDCLSCHAGPGAREAIRTTHPERTRCLQCHLAPPS